MDKTARIEFNQVKEKIKAKYRAAKNLPLAARQRANKKYMGELAEALWHAYYSPLPPPELSSQQKDKFKISVSFYVKLFSTGLFRGREAAEISLLKLYFRPVRNVKKLEFQKARGDLRVAYGGNVMYIITRTGKNSDKAPIGTAERKPIFPLKPSNFLTKKFVFPETTISALKSLCEENYQNLLQLREKDSGRE